MDSGLSCLDKGNGLKDWSQSTISSASPFCTLNGHKSFFLYSDVSLSIRLFLSQKTVKTLMKFGDRISPGSSLFTKIPVLW